MTKEIYMVYGGEVTDTTSHDFKDTNAIEVVGFYNDYDEAHKAWRGAAQRTVDNAETRFFIVSVSSVRQMSEEPKN